MADFLQEELKAKKDLWEKTGEPTGGAPSRPPDPRAAAEAAAVAAAGGPSPHEGQYDEGLRLDTDRWNLVYGDPSKPTGYFIGGAGEKGARWATENGGFTGKVDGKGLESRIGLGDDYALQASADFKQKAAELALMSGSTNLGELYGQMGGAGLEAGVRGSYDVGGLKLDPSLARLPDATRLALGVGDRDYAYTHGDDGTRTFEAGITQATEDTNVRFSHSVGDAGEAQKLALEHELSDATTLSGSLETANRALSGFSLGAAHALEGGGALNGNLGVKDGEAGSTTSFGLGFDSGKRDGLQLGLNVDGSFGPEKDRLAASLSQSYGSAAFANRLRLGAATDSLEGDSLSANASATGRLGENLYASGFGSYGAQSGQDPSWFAGGGLTYMPHPKVGLTAAGGYGSDGMEARLQADFFKKGVSGADSLEEQRARALVSLYLGVSAGGSHMNSLYGAGSLEEQLGRGKDPQFTLGVRLPF